MKVLKGLLLSAPLMLVAAVQAEDASPAAGKPYEAYWYVSLGGLDGEESAGQLENEGSSAGIVAGIGIRPWSYLALEAEIAGYTARYDTPPLNPPSGVSFDSRMRVSSAGVFGNAKAIRDFGRASVYAGAGIGIFSASAELEGTVFGFDAERIEDDSGFGYQLIVGGNAAITERSRVGVEYRRLELEADFGELSRGEADIGGDFFALTFRRTL